MSVRAYRVRKISIEKRPTFNLWQDMELTEILNGVGNWMFNENGGGFYEIDSESITDVLDNNKKLSPETKRILKKMLRQANADGGFVLYDCF